MSLGLSGQVEGGVLVNLEQRQSLVLALFLTFRFSHLQ